MGNDEVELNELRAVMRGMVVAQVYDADADEVDVVAMRATDRGWGVVDRHAHSTMSVVSGASDLDHDGIDEVWIATEREDASILASIAWSSTGRMTPLMIPDAPDRVTACFAQVDGELAFIETVVRGSSAGFRVHRLVDDAFEIRSGLLGRVLAAVSYQRADVLDPPPREEIWDGGEPSVDDTYFQPCPLDGRAIDVPRDAHYPVDEDPVADEAAILRVHELAQSYDTLPAGAGPIVEMQTASDL